MVLDRLVEREGREAPCRTHEIPLGQPAEADDLPAVDGVEEDTRALFGHRYGHAAREVLDFAASDPRLARRVTPDMPDLVAEAPFAARNEQARTLADVLLRRTRLGLLDVPALVGADAEAPRALGAAMGMELGWDEARLERELAAWHEVAASEGIDVRGGAPGARAAGGASGPPPEAAPLPPGDGAPVPRGAGSRT
jgi:glycerol-3-phosphate dehydrogenase